MQDCGTSTLPVGLCYNRHMFGTIYKLTNTVNGKIYVGQTTIDVHKYLDSVLHKTKFNDHRLLDKAIRKYGPDAWAYELLATAESREELDALEIHYIAKLDCRNTAVGYNICRGGERGPGWPKGNTYGSNWSSDKKRAAHLKISNALKGRKFSEEHKKKLGLRQTGEKNHMFGRKHSPETIIKMKESAKNRKRT